MRRISYILAVESVSKYRSRPEKFILLLELKLKVESAVKAKVSASSSPVPASMQL